MGQRVGWLRRLDRKAKKLAFLQDRRMHDRKDRWTERRTGTRFEVPMRRRQAARSRQASNAACSMLHAVMHGAGTSRIDVFLGLSHHCMTAWLDLT